MIGYVVVPGIGGSDDAHWQTLWERQWGAGTAVRIEPGSWSEPDLDEWVAAIERSVHALEREIGDIVLIAHSLGCWAVSTWVQRAGGPYPRGLLFVAPPDPTSEAFPADDAPTFANVAAHPLPCPSVVVASTDDPYCDVRVAEEFATVWGSELTVAGERGHLNSASGLGEWPEGRDVLDQLISR